MSIAGKVILISGAGTGIGRAIAGLVARAGGHLSLLGRRTALLEDACRECRQFGSDAIALASDVGDVEQVVRAVDVTLQHFDGLDGLVNNAGIARFGLIEDARLSDLELMLDAHLRGPINLIRATIPSLRQSAGSIVNVSSVAGILATPGRAFYGATKAALNHLTRTLARELAPHIRVNAILPGPVSTPIYDELGLSDSAQEQLKEELVRATPAGRFGTPEEVARWVTYLLDDENRWVTGALINIDGGRLC